jgi:hypothetical protein
MCDLPGCLRCEDVDGIIRWANKNLVTPGNSGRNTVNDPLEKFPDAFPGQDPVPLIEPLFRPQGCLCFEGDQPCE